MSAFPNTTIHPINHTINTAIVDSSLAMNVATADELPTVWVGHEQALQDLLSELANVDVVALDTEFIKRNTYYPILALLQINTGKRIYLIDAPKLDLAPLWEALQSCPLMVWHACGEDLGIFYLLADCPTLTNVFDTQIALGFLTEQLQMGYQKAVATELGVEIDKGESQSNWLQRPLSDAQMTYAADDVRYLLPMFANICQQLNDKGWTGMVIEDCQLYTQEVYDAQHIDDDQLYLSAADYRYGGVQLAFLQSLLAWREELARQTNQPRPFIIRKQAVAELAELMPNSLKQLYRHTSLHRHVIEQYGSEIIELVQAAKQLPANSHPDPITPPYRSKDKTLKKQINAVLQAYHHDTGVPTAVLIKKKWLTELFELVALEIIDDSHHDKDKDTGHDNTALKQINKLPLGVQGWRLSLVTSQLLPVLFEHKTHIQEAMGLDTP